VEHGQQADLGAQVLGIGGQLLQGSRGSSQEQVVHNPRIEQGNWTEGLGEREDDVEVWHREQFRGARF
jgi:hypothetical protein